MPTWFNWSPVAPLIERYADDGSRDLCTADITIQNVGQFQVSLVGTKHRIELIRIATKDSDGNLSELQGETVAKLVDHMIAILRLTHDSALELVRWGENTISVGAHDVEGKPSLNIQISEIIAAQAEIAAEPIRNVFVASMRHRPLFKLLADSQMPLLPLQYRYLSLYKILELEFRVARRWVGLDKLLEHYEAEYRSMKISARSLQNVIHEMRDKCAHIKVGGNDELGIIGLDGADAKLVNFLVPLLRRILLNHLSAKSMGVTFAVSPPESRPVEAPDRH